MCFCCKAEAQKPSQFVWGVNGHPLTQTAYYDNIDVQIAQINDLKLKSYRFDVLLDNEGCAKKDELFIQLLTKLNSNGIAALPVLKQSGLKGLNHKSIYNKSYTQGQNFASRYGNYLSVLEVNNEADNKMMLKGNLSGKKKGDYNHEKSHKIIAAIKGFIDGLKSRSSTIKVTLSVSYVHYYYLQLLQENNVNYDIIGCHWYSNMGPIGNAKPSGDDVLAVMKNRFKKPIWVTEFNHSKGTGIVNFATQNQYIKKTIPDMVSRGITGLFIYELYDQPYLKQKEPHEAFYGLVFKDNKGRYVLKNAYQGYKQTIQKLGSTVK
jgi:hypothetical protein